MSDIVSPIPQQIVVYSKANSRWETSPRENQEFAPEGWPINVKQIITPQWANEVLEHRNKLNRPINARRVDKYAREIITGNYQLIHSGIAFYEDGSLADGQHRLAAIAAANMPITAFVCYGLPHKAGSAIDEGRTRSDRDVAHLSGLDLGPAFISTANYLLELIGFQATRSEKLKFYQQHKDAVNFVVNNLTKKYVARAPIMAAIVKAYYTQDRTRLIELMDVLQTGKFKEGEDEAAFRLREFAIENGGRNDGNFRIELFQKTKAAMVYFLERKPMDRMYGLKTEPFPLPEEEALRREQTFQNRSAAAKKVQKMRRGRPPKLIQKTILPGTTVEHQPVRQMGELEYGG